MEKKMEGFADAYGNLEENVTKSFVDAKADLDLVKESLKDEVIRFKDSLRVEIDLKKAEVDDFKDNSTDELFGFKDSLQTEIDDKKAEIDQYNQEAADNLNGFMANITARVQKEIAELDLLEVKLGNPTVAFNVHNPMDTSIGTGENFQYADVLLNKGGGYNTITSKFVAPMTGLYYFSAHVCALAGKFVHYGIVVGDNVRAASSQREDTDSSCGSVSTIALVSDGEEVYVKCLSGNSYEAQVNEGSYRWNSFVGALIQ
ncbi:cerebellin-4-like [Mercenaria mercenaria]|uniref:cerebellin-4-like n=1 Tax=Mercenaria mercenaria TaxID=6596 RepID=UPI00234EFDFD|nr:cerebellin-4-like [Mercenaria mercenaria]